MGINELHEKIKFGVQTYDGYKYYDYPDGEDLLGKLAFTTKIAAAVSTFAGVLNSCIPPAPVTLKGKMGRILICVIPSVGMAATFTVVTYYSTVFRKKDDALNYALGGMAAGSLIGPMVGGPNGFSCGTMAALTLGFIGAMKKSSDIYGQKVPSTIQKRYLSSYYTRAMDTSLTAERKGNWSKYPPAQ